MVMGQQNVTCVGWRNRSIMVILFCRECCKYAIFCSSAKLKHTQQETCPTFSSFESAWVYNHVVYEVKFSVSVKSQKNKKARLSCSRAYKYRVMTFLLRLCRSRNTEKSSFDRFSMYKRTHWFFLEGRLVKKVLVRKVKKGFTQWLN